MKTSDFVPRGVWVVLLAALPAIGLAGDKKKNLLAPPFMDRDTGFTFSPPAGCIFFGKPKPGQIGRFLNADRSVSMSVSFEELAFRPEMKSHLARTVKVVRSRFRGMRIIGQTVFRVGVWPTGQWVGTSGSGGGAATHVQVMLQTAPRRIFLLTLRRKGVSTRKALAIMSAVRRSIRFSNPDDLAEQRTEALLAAKEVIAEAGAKLGRLELPEEQWMILKREGTVIGFIGHRVERTRVNDQDGYRLVFRAHTNFDGQVVQINRTVETTADLSVERWKQEHVTKAGDGKAVKTERNQTGRTANGKSRVVHRQGKRQWIQEGPIPEGYCTILVTAMFRRIIDPTAKRVHEFMRYDPDARRTLPISLHVGGGKEAVPGGDKGFRFLQVLGNGLPPTKIWTDQLGHDLRYEAAGGVVAARSTRGDIVRRWGRLAILRTLEIPPDR